VNKNLASNSCGGINEKKTKVIYVGQIHLFCWGGRWQTGSKMAARGGGVVWIRICLGEVVCVFQSRALHYFFFFFNFFNYTRGINNFKNK